MTNGDDAIHVLLVDDDVVDRKAVERTLLRNGEIYDLTTAASCQQAVDHLAGSTFDLVILDYDLGDATAFDLIGLSRGAPIVMITGNGNEIIAVEAVSMASDRRARWPPEM